MNQPVIRVALRVLGRVILREKPLPEDVEILRKFAPDLDTCEPDELACEIIQTEMGQERRGKVMSLASGD